MKTIPLRAVPNQRFTFSNGQDRWVIEIKVAISSMTCNIWLNDEPVVLGSRIVAGVPIIWPPRLATDGNFGILTEGGEEPRWEQFGTSQKLVFWESDMAIASSRFVDFRSRNISPSLAELTALVNTAMRIEDIGYCPPSWEALQEAISYAVSVVRSHAPEQGQILLATQILTSAMGGLIEWLSIDFAAGGWDEYLVFSRASTATYWGPSRTLLEAEVDEARIQHDPVTGECLGLLIEEQRTNHLLHSGDLTAAAWRRSSTVQVTRSPHAVWGHVNSVTILEAGTSTSNISHVASASEGFTGQACLNIVAKATDYHGVLWFANRLDGSTRLARIFLNLIDGSITSQQATSSYGSRPLGDGWWHFWYTHENTADLDKGCVIRCQDSTFVGDLCDIAHVWVEEGSFPTSYIPTEGSPTTRAADNAVIDISDVFNPDEGTLRITAQVPEGEVVASLGGMQVASDSDEKKTYRMTYRDYTGVPTVTLGNGIHSNLEYVPEAQS